MITESQLYWITRLDNVHVFFLASTVLLSIFIAVCGVWAFVLWVDSKMIYTDFLRYIRNAAIALLLVTVTWVFTPTTKEMAMIKVIPAVANSDFVTKTIPNEVKDLCAIAKDALRETLKGDAK